MLTAFSSASLLAGAGVPGAGVGGGSGEALAGGVGVGGLGPRPPGERVPAAQTTKERLGTAIARGCCSTAVRGPAELGSTAEARPVVAVPTEAAWSRAAAAARCFVPHSAASTESGY